MKTVLITGASRGIGAACALLFGRSGYHVFVNYNKSQKGAERVCEMIKDEGGVCTAIQADITDRESVRRMVSLCRYYGGGIDVLVNNAGIDFYGTFEQTEPQIWDDIINTDLTGAYNVIYAALPEIKNSGCGRIINISSVWGVHGASCEAAYSAAKAGIIGLTKALAKELGPANITVNCVAPGYIDTEMNARFDEKTVADIIDKTPLSRVGSAEDVAEAVLWLASEKASFITGAVLGADGGFM